jgi:hypothetical protein
LFADLEGQAAAWSTAERAAEVEERARIEFGGITLADRLRAALGQRLHLNLAGGLALSGILVRGGDGWALLNESSGREALVMVGAVRTVSGVGRYAVAASAVDPVSGRIGIRAVLRATARDRSAVRVHLTDGSVLDGTVDRVGADFLELARHGAAEFRRAAGVREIVLVPTSALAAVRRSAD